MYRPRRTAATLPLLHQRNEHLATDHLKWRPAPPLEPRELSFADSTWPATALPAPGAAALKHPPRADLPDEFIPIPRSRLIEIQRWVLKTVCSQIRWQDSPPAAAGHRRQSPGGNCSATTWPPPLPHSRRSRREPASWN
jgi:hypothetical protein